MPVKRLLESIAWKFLPQAALQARTAAGLSLPIRDKGGWGCLNEIFLGRVYDPFWSHLRDVRGWVDLGCNVGFFSLGFLDFLSLHGSARPETRVLLGDANKGCVGLVQEAIRVNGLDTRWNCEHVVVGPPGEVVSFSQFKFSVHSGIFSPQRGERVFQYRTTDLNTLLASVSGVYDLMKLDVEGAEMFVFKHYPELLRRFRYGICEWHAPQFDGSALRANLRKLGFELLEMRSQSLNYDLSRGHSWDSPVGIALWRNPAAAG